MKHWLEDIYRDQRKGLFGLALSVVREAAAAEDAVHEAFARMVKQSKPPTGDPLPYVYRAVRNAAIDQIRRRGTRPNPSQAAASLFATSPDEGPSLAFERSETKTMLMQAVDNLPEAEREAVVMRCFAGLTFRQIAEGLDQPLSTVSSRYQQGLKRLRQAMEASHANT